MQKSFAFLYTNNKITEREIKKIMPFTVASKTIKFLAMNLSKQEKDLYNKNYNTLMEKIKEVPNKWKVCFL